MAIHAIHSWAIEVSVILYCLTTVTFRAIQFQHRFFRQNNALGHLPWVISLEFCPYLRGRSYPPSRVSISLASFLSYSRHPAASNTVPKVLCLHPF